MQLIRSTVVCIVVVGVAACAELFGPHWATRLGSIVNGSGVSITLPDTVAASTDFVVSFETGGDGCVRAGNTQVTLMDSRTAEIPAYDDYEVNPQACTTILQFFHHTATLQFGQAGNGTVRLIGAYNDSTVTITRTVVVH